MNSATKDIQSDLSPKVPGIGGLKPAIQEVGAFSVHHRALNSYYYYFGGFLIIRIV